MSQTSFLFILTTGYAGEWNDPDEYPIYLPDKQDCGPGVSLVCQPRIENGYLIGTWLYLLLGNETQLFYRRYFPIPDTVIPPRGNQPQEGWERLSLIPSQVSAGGSLCYDAFSKSLFALVGGGNPYIYRYDIGSNTWDINPDGTPLNANDGSSLIAGPPSYLYSRLAAVFGRSDELEPHYICLFYPPLSLYQWFPSHYGNLPELLGSGASLAYDSRADDLYLVIGRESPDFWYNPDPWLIGEEDPQAQQTIALLQKTKVSYDFDKFVIHYSTNAATHVIIQIYNLMGKRVKTFLSNNVEKGEHQVIWDKTDDSNRKVASGVYFISIEKENRLEGLKVVIR